jgi:hypothetical protein
MLKKIAVGTALATLIAAPAFAMQGYVPDSHTINSVTAHYTSTWSRGSSAYAYVPGALSRTDRVYVSGKYVGQDPDANVRLQLQQRNPVSY